MSVIVIGAATADMEQYVVMEGHLTLSLADTLRHYKRTVMVLYACRRIANVCMHICICIYARICLVLSRALPIHYVCLCV